MDIILESLYKNRKSEEDFIREFDELMKMRNKIYLCIYCGENRIHPENGEDTCLECLSKI